MITSEITKLRQVLLHKPIFALKYLTPFNCRRYLFDDVLWIEKADEEHHYFATLLRHNGVEVLLLHQLLQEVLQNSAALEWLLSKRLLHLRHYAAFKNQLLEFLYSLSIHQLVEYLLGGLPLMDFPISHPSLVTDIMRTHDFLIPPLPNQLFIRDSSCWIGQGVVISSMKYPTRFAESLNVAAVYKFHPLFSKNEYKIWYDGSEDSTLPSLEGGDLLVISADVLLVGVSQRTSAAAIELLAKTLFAAGEKKQIIVVELPKTRLYMHLDVMMTMIRHDTFISVFDQSRYFRAWRLSPGNFENELVIEPVKNYLQAIAESLDIDKIQLIHPTGDYYSVKREQWADAANVLVIAPGEVIAYDRNVEMNRRLRAAGILVHEISGSELSRGRGGARCMSCPLQRQSRE